MYLHEHGGESRDFRGYKLTDTCQKNLDSDNTFFDIFIQTDQIDMGFEANTTVK